MIRGGIAERFTDMRVALRNAKIVKHNDDNDIIMREIVTDVREMEDLQTIIKQRSWALIRQIKIFFKGDIEDQIKFGMELESARQRLEDVL